MSYQIPSDVQQQISARMASGNYASEDEVLRSALRALAELDDDVAAVQAAIDTWHAGDTGLPLSDAFQAIRQAGMTNPSA